MGLGEFLRDAGHWRMLADLALIGVFGGFYIVPLYALIQIRSEPSHRSRVIAGNNIINALFMVVAAALAIACSSSGLTIPQLFLVTALLNAAVAIYIYTLVPEFLMRFLVWLLVHTVYRLEKHGLENVPEQGPAVLVCNHVSFVDALVIAARVPPPGALRDGPHDLPDARAELRVPHGPRDSDRVCAGRSATARDRRTTRSRTRCEHGDLVCIFPEGRITDDGEMNPFRPGIERIVARTPVPVVPMALRGLWGSFFSREGGAAMTRPFRRGVFSKIELVVGPARPAPRGDARGLASSGTRVAGR